MADNIYFKTGNLTDLPKDSKGNDTKINKGTIYFAVDGTDGDIYFDSSTTQRILMSARANKLRKKIILGVDLDSLTSTTADFDGSSNYTIGVSGILPTDHGGTGNSSITANRLVWSYSAEKLVADNHYADDTHIAINTTSKPSYNFYVNGTTYLNGNSSVYGNLLLPKEDSYVQWNTGNEQQKISVVDSSLSGGQTFKFSFSNDSGSTWNDLVTFNNDSSVHATKFVGALEGNADTATKVGHDLKVNGKTYNGSETVDVGIIGTNYGGTGTSGTTANRLAWASDSGNIITANHYASGTQISINSITAPTTGITFYVNGSSILGGSTQVGGNLSPTKTGLNLGNSTTRWAKLYIGTADSYGSATVPVYWNKGVPTAITSYSGTAANAEKVTHTLTFGEKSYDGSQNMEITASDLHIVNALTFAGTTTSDITSDDATNGFLNKKTVYIPAKGKYVTADNGTVVIYENKEYYWDADVNKWIIIGSGDASSYKLIQSPVSSPIIDTSSDNLAFIDTISQNDQGIITATKRKVQAANTTQGGIVTTETQSFAGAKTFANVTVSDSSGFNYTGIETATSNAARPIWFAYAGANGKPVINTSFTYNPATNTLTVGAVSGNATSASKISTARTLTVGNTGHTFDGSADVTWTLAEIGATVSNKWTAGTTAGPTLSTTVNGVTGTAVAIPSASSTASGAVTTTTQTFAGDKTFTGKVYINNTEDVGLNQNGALIIGQKNNENIGIDANEIMARSNGAAATLYLNNEGGRVRIGSGGLTINPSTDKTDHKLYVNGTSYLEGNTTVVGNLYMATGGSYIDWNDGTYHQRILNHDNSTTDDNVFSFQQSANSGSTWSTLLSIRDNGKIVTSGEYISTSCDSSYAQFRAIGGNYGFMIRNDGSNTHFLLTASEDQYGSYNSLRPFYINNSSGRVTMSNKATISANLGVNGTNDSYNLYVNGTTLSKGNFYHANSNTGIDGTWSTGTVGTAGDGTSSGVTGSSILSIGNATAVTKTSGSGANNSQGFLRLYGAGTGYGQLYFDDTYFRPSADIYFTNNNSYVKGWANGIRGQVGTNDYWRFGGGATASNSGYLEIATADDANEPIYVRQYSGVFATLGTTLTLLDESHNTIIPNSLTVGTTTSQGASYKFYVNGNSYFKGAMNFEGDLIPAADNTYNIGSSTKEWAKLYTRTIAARHLDADAVYTGDHNLYIGYGAQAATNKTLFYYSADTSSRTQFAEINSNGLYALTRFGVNGQSTAYNFYVNGTSYIQTAASNSTTAGLTINNGILKITNYGNTVSIGSQNNSWTYIYNSADIPFIFNKSVMTTSGDLGSSTYPWGNLYLSKNANIYGVGTKATSSLIRVIDNTTDSYGNGISIGGGGAVVIGAGESAQNMSVSGGTETLYLLSDGGINIEANGDTIANRIGAQVTTAGNLIPVKAESANTNAQSLGVSGTRWKAAFLGTADSYGSSGQPIYWNSGVPAAIDWHIGNSSVGEHNANNITYNMIGYYTSNGPSGLGNSTTDGAIYAQAYNSNWVGQIAQDYRNGNLFVRGKNNGTWQAWKAIGTADSDYTMSSSITYNPSLRQFITTKTDNNWNGQAYSNCGFKDAVSVTFKIGQTNAYIMAGLNSDPTKDASYSSIDYCWYPQSGGNLCFYESGTGISAPTGHTTYAAGDEFTIEYSNGFVRYYHNGVLCRSVARAIGSKLYFDSSFYNAGNIYDVYYGPIKSHAIATTDNAIARYDSTTGALQNSSVLIDDNGNIILPTNTGGIYKYVSAASTSPMIELNSNNLDASILKIDGNNPTATRDSQSYGFNLKYIGSGGGEDNSLDLLADNMDGTDVTAISVSNNGKIGIGAKFNTNYRLYVNGASYFNGNTTHNGVDYFANGTTYYIDNSGNAVLNSIKGNTIGIANTSASSGKGISLYGGPTSGAPTYGIMFAGTGTFGKHGGVTSDWATYFTMSDTTSRGWIFRRGSTNVASISGTGLFSGYGLTLQGSTTGSASAGMTTNPTITFKDSDGSQYASLVYNDYDSYQAPDSLTLVGNQSGTYFIAPNIKATSKFYGNLSGNADTATNADKLDGYHFSDLEDRYVNITGDTMTGVLNFTSAANSSEASTPTALSYGRLQADGTLNINANTDNNGTEYVVITAGHGLSSSTSDGATIGYEGLGVKGYNSSYNFYVNGTSYFNSTTYINTHTNTTPFYITRSGNTSEAVSMGIDDTTYYITYTNDETSNNVRLRLINTDTEDGTKDNTTDWSFWFNSSGQFLPGTSNYGALGSSITRWGSAHIYRDFNIYGNESTGDESHIRFLASDNSQRAIITFNGNTNNTFNSSTHLKIASSYGDIRILAASGNVDFGDGNHSLIWRKADNGGVSSGLQSGMYYSTPGRESVVFSNMYAHTGWIFVNGVKPSDRKAWNSLGVTPAVQIHHNALYINRAVRDADTADYNLYVNGTSYFAGATRIRYNTPNFLLTDTNTTADTYAIMRFGTTNSSGTTNENAAYIFLNGPSRSGDGGANTMTIRNNVGDLRLNNNTIITGTTYLRDIYHRNANSVTDGSWVTGATGTAGTSGTSDSTYNKGTLGTNIFTLGNNIVYSSATSAAVNNSKGYLRIYGAGSGYGELTYNDSMFSSTKSIYLSTSTNSGISNEIRGIMAANDYWRVAGGATASNAGYMEIATADDANEPIYVRQYTGVFASLNTTLTLLDAYHDTYIPRNTYLSGKLYVNAKPNTYSASSTYSVGARVYYNGTIYTCTTAITAAEAWTASHWTAESYQEYINGTSYYTNTLNFAENNVALNFRNNGSYYTTATYQTSGNEALVFATKNAVTSFMFINGEDSFTNHGSDRWTKITPALQIKNNSVYIGNLIGNNVTPSYKFYVNGTSYFSDLVTVYTGASDKGVKLGNTYLNAINGDLILQNNNSIRFGTNSWDYNQWAGLKYVHSSKTISLGLADGTEFTANSAQSGGILQFPGIDKLYLTNKYHGIVRLDGVNSSYTLPVNASSSATVKVPGSAASNGILLYAGESTSADYGVLYIGSDGAAIANSGDNGYVFKIYDKDKGSDYTVNTIAGGFLLGIAQNNGTSLLSSTLAPTITETYTLGTSDLKWANIYATTFTGTATKANDADTVDGYHASSLWRSDGGSWNPGANISLSATANSQEWSFDIKRNGYTGCYWHVWDSSLSTLLKVNADDGKVSAPYGFVGNLSGNATSADKIDITVANTTKLYLLGTSNSAPGGNPQTVYTDTGIYAGTTAGQLGASYLGINGDNTSYRLYVNGNSYVNGYIYGSLGDNQKTITIDGDANTYYPVKIRNPNTSYPGCILNITRGYSETAPDSWYTSTHKGGLTLALLWNGSSYWDGNGAGSTTRNVINVLQFQETYSSMVGGIDNACGGIIIWLRGGGAKYHLYSNAGPLLSTDIYYSDFTDSAKRVFSPKTTVDSDSINNRRFFINRTGDTMTGNLTVPTLNASNLFVINDSSDSSYDSLVYFRNYSDKDWSLIIDKNKAYTYGIDIRTNGTYGLRNFGGSRLIGSTIIGADAAPSYTLDIRGKTRSTDRIYSNEWIQFDNYTGLYSPNNNAHFYPNNTTTYGQWKILGSKGGYSGIQLGDSTGYMTLMDNGTDKGLYQESQGRWPFYYNSSTNRVGIRSSSTSDGYDIQMNGSMYVDGDTTFSGHRVDLGDGAGYFRYRTAANLESGFYFHTTGRESVVFANQYAHTGWIFANGIKPSDRKAWNSLGVTPAVQIHHNALYINRAVRDADTADYNLYVNGTSYLNGDTIVNGTLAAEAAGSQTNTYIAYPKGGGFRTSSSTQTGYLKITLPQSWTNTMMSFKVQMYEYSTGKSCEYTIGGYNYSGSSGTWINNPFAYSIGKNDNTAHSNLNVRLGHDGTKCAIYIGESNTSWSYMQVQVHSVIVGYSNYEYSKWASGWSVGFTTTLGTITATITNPSANYLATRALQDGNGNTISSYYEPISSLGYNTFKVTRGSSQSNGTSGYWSAMTNASSTGSPKNPSSGWWHIISMDWTGNDTNNWISQLAIPTQDSGVNNVYFRHNNASGTGIESSTWYKLWKEGDSVTGAVWNDYAEYREANTTQGGRCVREVGDDTLVLTDKRLMRGCEITSDTWGFSQGETEKAKTPIAVAGRVLAYTYEDRDLFRDYIGYSVCSGPDGTVSLMTEEEELKYPWAIVGTVSAVPDYEEWGGGDNADRDPVKVDGRIWIKVK